MVAKSPWQLIAKISGRLPLRAVLTVPFVAQVVVATGLVGYLSYQNGQQSVNNLANQFMAQVGDRVDQHLDNLLEVPQQLNQINLDQMQAGTLDLNNLQTMERPFWKQLQVFHLTYIGYANQKGDCIGVGYDRQNRVGFDIVNAAQPKQLYTYLATPQGKRGQLLETEPYDFTQEAWYADVVHSDRPRWSQIYNWGAGYGDVISISAGTPVFNAQKQVLGVLAIDFSLADLSAYIRRLKISPNTRVFITERSGLLVATSASQPYQIVNKAGFRLAATNSSDATIRAAAQSLLRQFGSFKNIRDHQALTLSVQNQTYFVQLTPWQDQYGLDWLIVVAVPESDFMGQINANTRTTIALCLLALFSSILLGMLTARWITQPISRLNQAAKAIAKGDLAQTVKLKRQDELGELSQSFNQMATQLQTSFGELQSLNAALTQSEQQLTEANQTLEQRVQERTQTLSQTLEKLQTAQIELIQSEKLAALGHLVAGIAHEINTPLGAIQASIGNIASALEQALKELPLLFQTLSPEQLSEFFTLLEWARQPKEMLSSREERQLKRTLKQALTEKGLTNEETLAATLSKMGITADLEPILPLLQAPNAAFILDTSYHLSSVQNNSQNIQLAVDRASRIVYALKSYIRQDASDRPVKTSISEGIDTVLTLYQNQIKRGVEVKKTYQPVSPIVCYPEELAQVWSNLISNALQAMNYQGQLTIAVSAPDQHILVEFTDTGAGIPAAIANKIFEPFFTTKPSGEGSGLGLSIVRKIVDKHQGKIEVTSQPSHTRFSVWLPLDHSA
jgi:signal transduction histidine kinase